MDWNKLFNDFADKYYAVPDFTNEEHVYALQNYLIEQGMLTEDVDYAIKTLLGEAPDKPDPKVAKQAKQMGLVFLGFKNWGKKKGGPATHKNVDGKLVPVGDEEPKDDKKKKGDDKEKGGKEKPKDDDKPINLSKGGKVDAQLGGDRDANPMDMMDKDDVGKIKDDKPKVKKKKPSVRGVTSESIDTIDGDSKDKTMNGEDPPPGTESSAVSEIGTGYAMGCLSENKNNMEAAEKCLVEKLSKSKLGKAHGIGDSKKAKDLRRGMLQTAKRENQKVSNINRELGWKNSETSHVGGSKSSLKNTVDKLREKGITEVNGLPIDEYEEVILGGGAGENPTDTMVVIVNEETGEAMMYHTSNKMSSKDQIANGSPYNETRATVDIAIEKENLNDKQKTELTKRAKQARENIEKHRANQKRYINEQNQKRREDAEDPKIARRVIDRLQSKKNAVSTAADKSKYWKMVLSHPDVKDYMKDNGLDKNNLSPDEEIAVYQAYTRAMESNPENARELDIQVLTRTYGSGQEELSTGKEPRPPVFDDEKLKSFYEKQTEEINNFREDMNTIKEGMGDRSFAERMAKRIHLDLAEGHNPGGVPNDKAETVMGIYDYKDLQQDSEGNMVQQKGGKGPYYKLDENGKITDEEVDSNSVQDFDCAVVADKGTLSSCLGVKEGEKASDNMGITMGEYEGTKAIIYDRDGNQIGVQTSRSKTGPGGAMQDSIAYHRDFQRCLAKQTKLQGKCG